MNRRNILKLIALSPLGLLLGSKRIESNWKIIKSKGALEKYVPYKQQVKTVFGYDYEINIIMTKDILIPIVEDGKIIWELNHYGNLIKILAICFCGDKNRTDCIVHKFESQILEDGKVSDEMYNNFITQVKHHFEKGICKEYGFHSPFIENITHIEIS